MSDSAMTELAIGDVVSFYVQVRPPWWAFWRKPKTERQMFTIVGAFPPLPAEGR